LGIFLHERLEPFELKLEAGEVATTSDGSVVMENFGTFSTTVQQLCYTHTLHLTVMKMFY
jgi:hypothetical protein